MKRMSAMLVKWKEREVVLKVTLGGRRRVEDHFDGYCLVFLEDEEDNVKERWLI